MRPYPPLEAALSLFCLALPLSIAGANMSWFLMLAAIFLYARQGGRIPWEARRTPLEKPLWAYLGVSMLTAAVGIDPLHSVRYLHQDAHKVWLYYLLSVALAVEKGRRCLFFLALGFAAAALVGILQTGRAHAFVHPATYGEQICVAVLGASAFLLKPEGIFLKKSARWAGAAFLALLWTALLLSNTRGALLAVMAGLAAIFLALPSYRKRLGRPAVAGGITLAALLAFAAADCWHPDRSLLRQVLGGIAPSDGSSGQMMRLTLWRVAWRMGLDHPLTGVGLNNYRQAFNLYYTGVLEGRQTTWGTAHNLYLHHFAERGVLGVAALGWLLWAFWSRARERALASPTPWNLWALGTAAAFLVMNLTEVALQTEIVWMLVFFVSIWAEARHA